MFFKIANSNCPVGYCTLELILRGRTVPIIDNSLVPLHGNHFLSGSLFRIEYNKQYTLIGADTMTGPAQTCILPSGHSMDHVYTFSCECQHILQTWASRPRKYDWPPRKHCQEITQMQGNLVASGTDGSVTNHLE